MSMLNSAKAPKKKMNLPPKKKCSINFSLDPSQLERLKRECKQTGQPSMSRYIREGMGLERKSAKINAVELVKVLDKIGTEIGRISDNIDRVGRYADSLTQRGYADCQAIHQFNLLMDKYKTSRKELVKAYRAVVRMV